MDSQMITSEMFHFVLIIQFIFVLCFGIPLTQSVSAYVSSLYSYFTAPQQAIDCKEKEYKSVPIMPPVPATRSYCTRRQKGDRSKPLHKYSWCILLLEII